MHSPKSLDALYLTYNGIMINTNVSSPNLTSPNFYACFTQCANAGRGGEHTWQHMLAVIWRGTPSSVCGEKKTLHQLIYIAPVVELRRLSCPAETDKLIPPTPWFHFTMGSAGGRGRGGGGGNTQKGWVIQFASSSDKRALHIRLLPTPAKDLYRTHDFHRQACNGFCIGLHWIVVVLFFNELHLYCLPLQTTVWSTPIHAQDYVCFLHTHTAFNSGNQMSLARLAGILLYISYGANIFDIS